MAEKEQSIVQVIQDMIREGESEKTILQNLRELGVPSEKAQKLLLVAQSDVLPVLQTEISRMLEKKMEQQKLDIIHALQSELQLAEKKTTMEIKDQSLQEVKDYEKYLENKFAIVQSQVSETSRKAIETSDSVREKLLTDENRLRQLETEGRGNQEMQIVVHKNANIILATLGILFALATVYLFYQFTQGGAILSTENLIIGVVLGLISITILFVSTLF